MKNKIIAFAVLAVLLITVSCGRKHSSPYMVMGNSVSSLAYDDVAWEHMSFNSEGPAGVESQSAPAFRDSSDLYGRTSSPASADNPSAGGTSADASTLIEAERKLVKRANVRIRVENLGEADAFITTLMNEYNAYSASTIIEENTHSYSLRVPSQYYEVFLTGMNGMGRMLHRQETTEDVTLRYYDLEGQLATKRELLRTFQSYLGRANNIEEILAVEARISQLQYDIERTGTQLRNLGNLVDYATIDLRLVGPVAAMPTQGITFGESIKQLFGGFSGFLSAVALAILGIIIYGIPILLLLGLLFWLFFGKIGLARKLWGIIRK